VLRRATVVEPVEPEIAGLEVDELARRVREQHLAEVASRADPGGTVEVGPEVFVSGLPRLARVKADASLQAPGAASASRTSDAIAAAARADANAAQTASPRAPISTPPCRTMHSPTRRRLCSSASA